jgi:hypothetical protein
MAKKPYRPPLKKRILKSRFVNYSVPLLASLWLRFIYGTSRVTHEYPTSVHPFLRGEKPAIFCFWHGRLAMQAFAKPPRPMLVLISHHNDGALITSIMRWFNIGSVRGSKSNGGSVAVREMFTIARRGDNICITPDGPRGPAQVAADGTGYVAMMTGYPIIPISFSATRYWRLKTWDRFLLPKPFTRIHFVAGDPIEVPRAREDQGEIVQHYTTLLTDRLNDVTARADRHCGVAA